MAGTSPTTKKRILLKEGEDHLDEMDGAGEEIHLNRHFSWSSVYNNVDLLSYDFEQQNRNAKHPASRSLIQHVGVNYMIF